MSSCCSRCGRYRRDFCVDLLPFAILGNGLIDLLLLLLLRSETIVV
jgi:hypothetical protein